MIEIEYPWLSRYVDRFNINKLAHSQLFSGKSGIGKFYFAKEISKSILCTKSSNLFEYCNECSSCKSFDSGSHPDFKLIQLESDSKVIKISQLRGGSKESDPEGIINFSNETPLLSKSKIIVINSSDKMNAESQNFLLKTLEEPSKKTYIFLISSKPYSLKPTLLSRLNHMEINFPKKNEILAWLQKSNMELDSQELNFLDDLNLIDINPDELIKARSERNEFSTDLMQCHSPKQLEKIASKWDDSFLSTKLNWLSKIIFYSICKKLNDSEVQSYYFNENISYLAKTKDLVELFKLSNELNIFIKELAGGINLNNKIQIKALLSSY
ncbi:hypothetical protein N9S29_01015 [SAR86 cluster bacterium]|jgi:DNA polymerase-3 subunit delta'|nr:hypothetical protein [SAR86 cluster bacterium]